LIQTGSKPSMVQGLGACTADLEIVW
jgi:hypothetical protein